MIKEIATMMKGRISHLPFIDKLAGLVQTIETTTKDDTASVVRFPASLDSSETVKQWNYTDLVPNNSKRSIIYFEAGGLTFGDQVKGGSKAVASLRAVCWLNDEIEPVSDLEASASLIGAMATNNAFNVGQLISVTIKPKKFLSQEENIFSRYTYDEKIRQYLMMPYHAFAIDFEVDFTVSNCNIPVAEIGALSRIINPLANENRLLAYGEVYTVQVPAKSKVIDLNGETVLDYGQTFEAFVPEKSKVIDNFNGVERNLEFGEVYSVNYEPEPDEIFIIAGFPLDSENVLSVLGTTDNEASYEIETLVNVSSVSYKIDGEPFTVPFYIAQGETLEITITRTNADLPSSVKLKGQ